LKLGECGKDFPKKGGQLIELILMNPKTPYGVLFLTFCASWTSKKEDGKDYIFDILFGFLIRAHEKLLDQGKLKYKKHTHLLKGKGQHSYREIC